MVLKAVKPFLKIQKHPVLPQGALAKLKKVF
jgi:hypothetical protein